MWGRLFQGILCCLLRVRSCSFSSALVRSLPAWRLVRRPVSRPVCLVGAAVRRRAGCLLAHARMDAVRAMSFLSSRLASRLFGTGSGEVWRPACLLGVGVGVDVECPVPVPVARAIACPCLSIRWGSDGMRRMAVAWRHQVPALLAYRVVSPRSSTRGTGREAGRIMRSGSDMLGGWSVRAVCLAVSRAGCSDEMMRNDGAKEVSCFRCPMISVFLFSYFHRPAPSPRLFSVGLSHGSVMNCADCVWLSVLG